MIAPEAGGHPITVPAVAGTLLLLAYLGLVGSLAWGSRAWPLVHDAPLMHYVAWRLSEGAVPYRDVFDMNFPGVYLLHWAVIRWLGAGDAAWRAFDLGWLAATSLVVAALAAPWGPVAAAGGALFFAAHHLAGGAWEAGQRDFLLCLFLLLGALGVTRWLERRRPGSLAWAGFALGAGLTVKPHAVLLVIALGVVVAAVAWRAGHDVASPALFALALAVPVATVVGWVALAGGLEAWRGIVLHYLVPLYSRLGRPAHWGFYRWEVWMPVGGALALSLMSLALGRRLTARHGIVLLGLAYGVVHYFGQGKGWEYHLYPAAAFAAALLFSAMSWLLESRRFLVGAVLVVLLVTIAGMLAVKGAEATDPAWIREKVRRVDALTADLRQRLGPGDLVQVLDTTDGGIHALLRLRRVQPTRFIYDFHFFHDTATPVVRGLRREFLQDLAARPPRLIVLFRQGWPSGEYDRVDRFPGLRDLLLAGYRLDARGDGYVIYAKRDRP